MADFPSGLIVDVARNSGRDPVRRGAPRGEWLIRCPWAENHVHGDEHPSCRINPEKNTFYCDPCAKGGGVVELAQALGVSLPVYKSSSAKRERKKLHFATSGPITTITQQIIADTLAKAYPLDTWKHLGVEQGAVDGQPAIAFPLPGGGYKTCLYQRPDSKGKKPYTLWYSDGGAADLLFVGDHEDVLLVAGEWDMLAALSAKFPCVATSTGGEGHWKPEPYCDNDACGLVQ